MAGKTELSGVRLPQIDGFFRTICGYQVELTDKPDQAFVPFTIKFFMLEEEVINIEILDFTKKGIIEPVVQKDLDKFISNIFVRLKSDGGIRVILNIKPFNQQYVTKYILRWRV